MEIKTQRQSVLFFVLVMLVLSAATLPGQIGAQTTDVEAFITRFYQQCLGREPDTAGLTNWADSLNSGANSGSDLAFSFIFSDEFQSNNTTDDEYLQVLYHAFFNREPDPGGYSYWRNLLSSGTDRATVLEGFTSAQEFISLCETYGIPPNSSAANDLTVEGFVTRFYQQCLGRKPDTGGLDNWVNSLNSGTNSGSDLAFSFIFSDEFQSRQTNDNEYLKILYRAFFNREPDQGGYNNWINLMAGGLDRASVLEGFTTAQEFVSLCDTYGIQANRKASASASFFPSASDQANPIQWVYQINGGAPISAYYEGAYLKMQFSNINLSVNQSDMVRRGNFSGTVSGDANGFFTANVTENIVSSGTSAVLSSQAIEMKMDIVAEGINADVKLYAETSLTSPVEWFLSRSDLDQLAYGKYDQTGTASGTVSGYAKVSAMGYNETVPFSEHVTSADTWEIIEKLNSYTVNGVTYNNVVVINRHTIIPLGTYSGGQDKMTIKYWVAEGIGMIKGIGQYQLLGQPLSIDLVSTNLSQ